MSSSARPSHRLLASVIVVALGLAVAWLASSRCSRPDGIRELESYRSAERERQVLQQAASDLETIRTEFPSALDILSKGQQPATFAVPSQSECVWWPGVVRNTYDIPFLFTHGKLKADLLWRNELLNREDRAPCPDDKKALDSLLRELNQATMPVSIYCDEVEIAERTRVVRAGLVPAFDAPPKSDLALRSIARVAVEDAARR